MANCLVPSCHCSHYQGPEKGKLLAYRPDCGGCGHQKVLHRLPANTDEVIMRELLAAESVPCCSLILMSELPSMRHFSSYDLIPIPPDEADNQEASNVLCLCQGFVPNMSSILYQFTGASFDSIQSSLPSVPCTRCTHPLLVHQRTHPSHYLCDQRVLRLRGRVSLGGLTLPSLRLVDLVMGPENRVGFVAVIRSDSSYRLVGSEKVLEIEGARKGTKRRSGRLAGRTNVANETKEVETNLKSDASIFHQLTEFFNAALENAKPIDQCSNHEPTCVRGCWCDLLDDQASHQFVVAVGTEGGVTICVPSDGSYKGISTTHPVTAVEFCIIGSSLLLFVSETLGLIKCWKVTSDSVALVSESNSVRSSITDMLWIKDNDYLIAGTELGEAYLYQIKIDDEDKGREGEECTLELCQKIQSCLAPVTALHWLHNEQILLVGSADNDIHVLSMTSLVEDQVKESILKYFVSKRKRVDKLVHCVRMKGHQSFVNSITCYRGNVLSIGWDGYAIFWSSSEIQEEVKTVTSSRRHFEEEEWSGGTVQPSLLYKLGVEHYLSNIPCGLWGVMDESVVTVYQGMEKQLILAMY